MYSGKFSFRVTLARRTLFASLPLILSLSVVCFNSSMLSHSGDRHVHRNDNQLDVIYRLILFQSFSILWLYDTILRKCLYFAVFYDLSCWQRDYNINCPGQFANTSRQATRQHFNPSYDVPPMWITFLLKTNERTFVYVTLITSRKGFNVARIRRVGREQRKTRKSKSYNKFVILDDCWRRVKNASKCEYRENFVTLQ